MVLGIRGMPNVQGGVETHAEQLYSRLAAMGCKVEVLVRTPFVPRGTRAFGQVKLRRIWSPRRPGLEALVHSLLGVVYAGFVRPDILHIHAIGPAIVAPLARLLGLRVVVTHHGQDYDRDKWGSFARWVLRTGERLGMRYSSARIVISKVISDSVRNKFGVDSQLIPNGVVVPTLSTEDTHARKFGLEPGRYFLQVSRIVPEKRQLDLIHAYALLPSSMWKLVLVGGLDSTAYSREVEKVANATSGVILTGFQNGETLAQLYTHAGGFILPSSHEGLPIALLEALSYGLPVLASDIPANIEVGLDAKCYFRMGDELELSVAMDGLIHSSYNETARQVLRRWVIDCYDWDQIAARTLALYQSVIARYKPRMANL
ncbi:MAG: glycosyltransferase family 4 protein [Steroidobacteraceae bacterium]